LSVAPTLWPTIAVGAAMALSAVNLVTFLMFWSDKRRASRAERRLPERRLLWLAALGGSPAALVAQRMLRHKTLKQPFATRLLIIAALQAGALGVILVAIACAALGGPG